MISVIPLMIIPFILYNLGLTGVLGANWLTTLDRKVLDLSMLSGAEWTMSIGDVLIVIGLAMLFLEILKSTRIRPAVLDHVLSTVLFVVFLIEFLLVAEAATHVFFILMAISFVDVIAGFSVTIRSAGRDVSIGR